MSLEQPAFLVRRKEAGLQQEQEVMAHLVSSCDLRCLVTDGDKEEEEEEEEGEEEQVKRPRSLEIK